MAILATSLTKADPTTVASQISLLKEHYSIAEVVMVGDRGVIKAKGKAALSARGFRYITALTNACLRQAFGTTENT